jgi:hypothetical protein
MTVPRHPSDAPQDAGGQAPPAAGVICPFCGSARTVCIALFGSQLLTSQHRCRACGSYFEAVRTGPGRRGT